MSGTLVEVRLVWQSKEKTLAVGRRKEVGKPFEMDGVVGWICICTPQWHRDTIDPSTRQSIAASGTAEAAGAERQRASGTHRMVEKGQKVGRLLQLRVGPGDVWRER